MILPGSERRSNTDKPSLPLKIATGLFASALAFTACDQVAENVIGENLQTQIEILEPLPSTEERLIAKKNATVLGEIATTTQLFNTQKLTQLMLSLIDTNNKRDTVWFVFSGFNVGVKGAKKIAQSVQPTLEQTGDVAVIQLGSQGVDIDTISELMQTLMEEKGYSVANIYGSSMGAMIAAHALNDIAEDRGSPMEVEKFVLDSSPTKLAHPNNDENDVKEDGAYLAALLAEGWPLDPGRISVLFAQLISNVLIDPDVNRSIIEQTQEAFRRTIKDTDMAPTTASDQLGITKDGMTGINVESLLEGAQIYYIRAEQAANDEIVDVEKAYRHWSIIIGKFIFIIRVHNGGHANSTDKAEEYNSALVGPLSGNHEYPPFTITDRDSRANPTEATSKYLAGLEKTLNTPKYQFSIKSKDTPN